MSISYATVAQMQQDQNEPANSALTALDDQTLYEFGVKASEKIAQKMNMDFAPRLKTHYISVFAPNWRVSRYINGRTLHLPHPLLELNTITLADSSALTIDTDARVYPRDATPADELRLINSLHNWTDYGDSMDADIAINGLWGYRTHYSEAWISSGDSVQDAGGINASVATITVTDPSAANGQGLSPRFSPGQLIAIDDEYIAITAIDSSTKKLSVIRGIMGTTAASHDNGAQILSFIPEPIITRAVMRWANLDLARRGNFARVTFDGVAVTQIPEIPDEVVIILNSIHFRRLGSI